MRTIKPRGDLARRGPGARAACRALIPLVLLLGIAAVSTASILVRFAQQGAPSLAIAAGRLALATLVLAPLALTRHRSELRALTPRDLGLGLVEGPVAVAQLR